MITFNNKPRYRILVNWIDKRNLDNSGFIDFEVIGNAEYSKFRSWHQCFIDTREKTASESYRQKDMREYFLNQNNELKFEKRRTPVLNRYFNLIITCGIECIPEKLPEKLVKIL